MSQFEIDGFSVRKICDLGLWLVTARCQVDVGLLFLRYQEFYESPNKDFSGKKFQLVDYLKWQCTKKPKEYSFTYFDDYEGFNVPGDVLDQALKIRWDDTNRYDELMKEIVDRIKSVSGDKYYLIGAASKNSGVIDHEIAHGIYYLSEDYKTAANELVNGLGVNKYDLMDVLRDEGYGDNALLDEAQAYLSTGLTDGMWHMEKHRIPFMQLFYEHRSKLIFNA